ncbi:MAG: HYR domain-containing protein [Chloroflexota bacterium]
MPGRQVARAGALAVAMLLMFSGTVLADSLAADGDEVTVGVQTYVDLGSVAPGATISRDVTLTLFCGGLHHVDPGQVVTVSEVATTSPVEGGSISATDATIGPVPGAWADDTAGVSGCSGPMEVAGDLPSHVTLVAPTTPGLDYTFVVEYGRTFTPAGVADASSITGFTSVAFVLDVVEPVSGDSIAPTFTSASGDIEVMTSDPGGMVVDYPVPTATDDVDASPRISCDPGSGTTFPIGATTVTCIASDAAGNSTSQSFTVMVHVGSVVWDSPVRASGTRVHRGRSVPIKVRAWMDGMPLSGPARFAVVPCGGSKAAAMTVEAGRQTGPGRWMTVLETGGLTGACYQVNLVVAGHAMGSFQLDLVDGSTSRCSAHRWDHKAS